MSAPPTPGLLRTPKPPSSSRSPQALTKTFRLTPEVSEQLQLRRRLRESNRSRQFNESITTARQLHTHIRTTESEAIRAVLDTLGTEIDIQLTQHGQIVKQLREEFIQREIFLENSIDDSFSEMRARHTDALAAIEFWRFGAVLRADKRASSDVHVLERISVTLADREEFDAAIETSRRAEDVHANDVEARKAAVNESFIKLERQLLAQFAKEISLLEERFSKSISGMAEEFDTEVVMQQRQRAVTVQRSVQTAIHRINRKIGKKEREQEIAAVVTNFAKKKVQQHGMARELAFA
jgi:predicted nucleotidyltransferase